MHLWNDFVSLIYPRTCVCCDKLLSKQELHICNHCFVNLPKSNFFNEAESELDKIFHGRIPLEKAGSYLLFEKSGKVQKILHSIKYESNKELAYLLGVWYANDLIKSEFYGQFDFIIPVPLHPLKHKQRGFNQSLEFSKGLKAVLQQEIISDNLIRTEFTSTQTRKSKIERWENVKDKFELLRPRELNGKTILLVDDVITTGATLEACFLALSKALNVKLYILSLAYAKKN